MESPFWQDWASFCEQAQVYGGCGGAAEPDQPERGERAERGGASARWRSRRARTQTVARVLALKPAQPRARDRLACALALLSLRLSCA